MKSVSPKTTIPPRRGQIKRRIIGQLVSSVANMISIKKKKKIDRNEVGGFSSGCNSSPLTPDDDPGFSMTRIQHEKEFWWR
ncbi:hypothetical protein CTI12_AA493340 [Artemisia annua]|uniref:Uncharacterized protein n=1 Tax=Artemisia annua TaxID=35608 RepID=A0A2U1L8T2_ARTAN|nr:hypothetical protein CTI12_AA493340 [Artemisia annua]